MPYGHTVPVKLDAFLNTIGYPVEAPEYAMPKPDAIADGDLDPMFIPDKHSFVLTRATIAMMIDWSSKVIPFKILAADDILEINLYLTEYIRQLSAFAEMEDVKVFLAKAKRFHSDLQRSVVILSKTRPDALKIIKAKTLSSLFSSPIQRMDDDTSVRDT